MVIKEYKGNKKDYLPLLLLADEEEAMVDKYLERGTMFILDDGGVKAECVVTDEDGILEIKNLAVDESAWRKGYGRTMIEFLKREYSGKYSILQVGTGEGPYTIPFYEACGFTRHHVIKHFFRDNYAKPYYDDGVLLDDMVMLRMDI